MTVAFPPLSNPALEVVRVPCLSDNYVWLLREPTTGADGCECSGKAECLRVASTVPSQCYVEHQAAVGPVPLCCLVTSSSKHHMLLPTPAPSLPAPHRTPQEPLLWWTPLRYGRCSRSWTAGGCGL